MRTQAGVQRGAGFEFDYDYEYDNDYDYECGDRHLHPCTPAPHPSSMRALPIKSVPAHLGLTSVSAVLLGLAFPTVGWGLLAHVALVPMSLLALRSGSARRLVWTTWLVSWVWWLVMLRWLWPVTGPGLVALAAYLGVYWPLALLGVRWLHRKFNPACVLSLPMVWVALELVRGYVMADGFPWFGLGHTQAAFHDDHLLWQSRIIQTADLFGDYTVSFLVAMTNGLLVDGLTRPWVHPARGGRKPRLRRTLRAAMLAWACALLGAWLYGQYRIGQYADVTASGPAIALVQTNIAQSNKNHPSSAQMDQEWAKALARVELAAKLNPKPDVILVPESTPPFAINPETVQLARDLGGPGYRYHEQIAAVVGRINTPVMIGAFAKVGWRQQAPGDPDTWDSDKTYNSVFYYRADGTQSETRYDKAHLVPFGEFVPWVSGWPTVKRWFIKYLTPYGDFDYTIDRGGELTLFEIEYMTEGYEGDAVETVHVATPICFEDTVARLCRRMVYDEETGAKRAEALINLTNDGWFAGSRQPYQHLQVATLRCIENRVPMVRCVNTGVSGYVDSLGRVTAMVQDSGGRRQGIEGVASAGIRRDRRQTLFGKVGHLPVATMAAATAILLFAGLFRRDKVKMI